MSIGEFAKRVGVSPLTVRRWIYAGKLKPLKTVSGRYRFTDEHLKQALSFKGKPLPRKTVIYARVSTRELPLTEVRGFPLQREH